MDTPTPPAATSGSEQLQDLPAKNEQALHDDKVTGGRRQKPISPSGAAAAPASFIDVDPGDWNSEPVDV